MMRRRHQPHAETVAMLAAVASESLPYTDPRADYPAAQEHRATRAHATAPRRHRTDEDALTFEM
ncbi:hypothetical protein Aca07nite_19820 [Actinoplanes capillaceus]|uniref:Uncharacterized protein n=1 Tax=Actinoplanes campanulatus TaxID=113559 RepID=A0ABQ3WCH7_9ACTN|nr:hypothetical protein [Actinoplanes capillaceus]GID44707.1 hypothetical protein Aca07nite_19820 [Actinoplanes capillaceus]